MPGLAAAWAVHDGEKIDQDDLAHPARNSNAGWRDGVARILGGRNELVAFQVVVESDDAGINGLQAALPRLTERAGDAAITYAPPGDDPSESLGRPIQIFTENYMNVEEPSQARWVFDPGSPAAPEDPTGWKPVQLVPENARPERGGLPINVAPRRNQALWIEVYVPRGLPLGMYDGAVELRAGGGLRRLPVELEVFDFELPDKGSLAAMVYFEPDQVVRYHGRALTDRFQRFAHRHRIELVGAYSTSSLAAARGRFDGSDFTAARGYDGPGAGVGNTIAPASFYGPGTAYDERASAWASSDAWMTSLAANAPGARTFLYMPDEPGPSQYDRIHTIADNLHSNPGPGRALPIFVTRSYASDLDGAIDIWCSSAAGFQPARAVTERAKGKQYWFYNGTRPETGAIIIDAPATEARWRHNFQKQGERDQDVWSSSITFDNRGQPGKPLSSQGFIHGDGVLLYPGEEVLHPLQDRGIAGPIGTIQLANLRRGLQDHLYLSLARQKGLGEQVDAELNEVVPAVFSESGPTVTFAQTGDRFEHARYRLARALAGAP